MQRLTEETPPPPPPPKKTKSKSKSKSKAIRIVGGGFVLNQCTRCGHKWIQRKKEGRSVKCPRCKSRYWSEPYQRPTSGPKIRLWYQKQKEAKLKKKKGA